MVIRNDFEDMKNIEELESIRDMYQDQLNDMMEDEERYFEGIAAITQDAIPRIQMRLDELRSPLREPVYLRQVIRAVQKGYKSFKVWRDILGRFAKPPVGVV